MCNWTDHAMQTFDQQLYAFGQPVQWAFPTTFDCHVLQMSGFHTLSCFIAAIGKLWGNGSLHDLFVDSSIYTAATVIQMLCGKPCRKRHNTIWWCILVVRFGALFRWLNDKIKKLPEIHCPFFPRYCHCFNQGKLSKLNILLRWSFFLNTHFAFDWRVPEMELWKFPHMHVLEHVFASHERAIGHFN